MQAHNSKPGRTVELLEVSVFILLIAPSLAFSFFLVRQGSVSFVLIAFSTILRDLGLVGLILYLLWRNAEPADKIGWTCGSCMKEISIGILLFLPLSYGMVFVERVLKYLGFSSPKTPLPSLLPGRSLSHLVLALVLITVVAITEETLFRGYLILRLKSITGSSLAAVLISSALFSFGHGYEGSAGVITVGLMGLAFGVVYLWRQSLVAPIVMHFLQDFIAILLVPLLGAK